MYEDPKGSFFLVDELASLGDFLTFLNMFMFCRFVSRLLYCRVGCVATYNCVCVCVAFPGFDYRVLKITDILAFLVFRFIPAR